MVLKFLKEWWLGHINKKDRQYTSFLRKLMDISAFSQGVPRAITLRSIVAGELALLGKIVCPINDTHKEEDNYEH